MNANLPLNQILCGDALSMLRTLPDDSVHCCVTSPPYFGLRDYGIDGQIGQEPTPTEFVQAIVEVFREVRRVLRSDGTCWVNLGDSYSDRGYQVPDNKHKDVGNGGGMSSKTIGIPPKNLIGIPWRVAFGLQDDGWILRSDIIWSKPNPMPESVEDRPTKSHEYIFLLAKSPQYFYDIDAIREPHADTSLPRALRGVGENNKWTDGAPGSTPQSISQPRKNARKYDGTTYAGNGSKMQGHSGYYASDGSLLLNPLGRNKRTVWTVSTKSFKGAHFATFPPDLIEPCILAGSPETCCAVCGAPYTRVMEREAMQIKRSDRPDAMGEFGRTQSSGTVVSPAMGRTLGFEPTCACGGGTSRGVVLDPFMGSGTTAREARRHNRHYIGIELNPKYVRMAERSLRLPFEQPVEEEQPKANDYSDLPLFGGS